MVVRDSSNKRHMLFTKLIAAIREEMRLALVWNETAAAFAGLHPTDATILFFIYESSSVTAAQVSAVTGLTTGATTAALNRLERGGFISRERDNRDKRRVIIRTKELPSQFRTIRRQTESELRSTLNDKSDADIQKLIAHHQQTSAMLLRIIEKLEQSPSQG